VALVRGINVAGRAKLAMSDLRQAFADADCSNVTTYIQSGNVVFRSSRSATRVTADVAALLGKRHGLDVAVVVRTGPQLASVVARNPFSEASRDRSKLHVTFLAGTPTPARVDRTESTSFLPDEFRVLGREVYVYCPGGYGRTKINNTFFERSLGVAATTRNWNTVTTLAKMSAA
jgi:uncharacterized protein (DUF1697 family)